MAWPLPSAQAFQYACLRDWFVDGAGSDAATGDVAAPFKTIGKAVTNANLQAGDCIKVAPGLYRETVRMTRGGSSNSPTGFVSLISSSPGAAHITSPSPDQYSVVNLAADYLVVDGFEISGGGGHCVDGSALPGRRDRGPHHLAILRNTTHDCGGGGIELAYSDWYWILNNRSFNNAHTNRWQTSGVSVYEPREVSYTPTERDANARYHITIASNISHDNMQLYACPPTSPGCHTDGNGIIIDDFHNDQRKPQGPNYPFETLVFDNVVYRNGGRGIQINKSDHVTVINNTAFDNNLDPLNNGTWRGEIQNVFSSYNFFANNIGYAKPRDGYLANNSGLVDASCCGYDNIDNHWRANLSFNGAPGDPAAHISPAGPKATSPPAGNFLGVDPGFVQTNSPFDFSLAVKSPARAAADRQAQDAAAIDPALGRFTGDLGAAWRLPNIRASAQ